MMTTALAAAEKNEASVTSVKWALASLSLATLLSSLGTSIANVGLPTLAPAFGASFGEVQWVVLAYLLAITTLIVSAGKLGDVFGRRKMLVAGLVLFTVASALSGVAPSLWFLLAARVGQGAGAAIMLALSMALVAETVAKERTGSAMGMLGTMSAIGTALGPTLGGVLIAGLGWRAIFLVNVPLGLLAVVLAWRHLPGDRVNVPATHARFDVPGTLLMSLTLTAYALSVTMGDGTFAALNMTLLVVAVIGLVIFLVTEARVPSPLIRLSMLRNRALSTGLALTALVSTVVMATLVVGPFYLSRALGLNAAEVGMVMSVGPLMAALCGVLAGRIVDRLGASQVVITGLAVMVVGTLALALLPAMYGTWGYISAIAVLTPGYQLFQAANNTGVMLDVEPGQRGVISGMLNLFRNLGLITGAAVMGAVFASAAMTRDFTAALPAAVAGGMQVTFLVATGLLVAALAVAIATLKLTARGGKI